MRQLSHQLYYKIFSSSLQLQELPIRTPCIEIIIDWSSYNKDTDLGLAIDARAPFFRRDFIHYYWSTWGSTLVLKKVIQHCPCATHVRPRTAATLQPPTTPPPSPFYSRAEATTTSPHQTKRGPTSPCYPPQAPQLLCCFTSSITTYTTTLLLLWSETISVSVASVHTFPAFNIRFGPRTRFLRTKGQD